MQELPRLHCPPGWHPSALRERCEATPPDAGVTGTVRWAAGSSFDRLPRGDQHPKRHLTLLAGSPLSGHRLQTGESPTVARWRDGHAEVQNGRNGQGLSGLGFPLWFGSLLAAPGGAGQGPARGSRGRSQKIRRRGRGTRGGGGALPALQGEGVVIGPGLRPVRGGRRRFRGSRHRGLALRSGDRRSGGGGIALGGGLRGRTGKGPEAHAPARGRWRACHGSETGIPGWGRRGGAGRADPG